MALKLSDEDVDIIEALCERAVRKALDTHPAHQCRFTVPPGDLAEVHAWATRMKSTSEKIGNIMLSVFFTVLAGGLVAALWVGVKDAVRR